MKTHGSSRRPGFHRLDPQDRRQILSDEAGLDLSSLVNALPEEQAAAMVENAIGAIGVPLGIACNFTINGLDVSVPMAIEEPSVIAAASNAAKMVRAGGGFQATTDPSHTVAQIEMTGVDAALLSKIDEALSELLAVADATQPELVSLGGGARQILCRANVGGKLRHVVHLVVDCKDAMGANIVNTMAEALGPEIEKLTGAEVGLKILTNLADQRLAKAECRVPLEALAREGFSGEQVALGVVAASDFAIADPYRAATHNKGIFNGIDAVLLATGNDWRAVEAGAHAFAARSGRYVPLATWRQDQVGFLCGTIEMPLAVGIVGGASRAHPAARSCIELIGAQTAADLACVVVCAGLASNLAALAALSSEGIQQGHMKLHLRKEQPR